ncbi:hypothetical protein D3C81_1992780 [compost metagenome]
MTVRIIDGFKMIDIQQQHVEWSAIGLFRMGFQLFIQSETGVHLSQIIIIGTGGKLLHQRIDGQYTDGHNHWTNRYRSDPHPCGEYLSNMPDNAVIHPMRSHDQHFRGTGQHRQQAGCG